MPAYRTPRGRTGAAAAVPLAAARRDGSLRSSARREVDRRRIERGRRRQAQLPAARRRAAPRGGVSRLPGHARARRGAAGRGRPAPGRSRGAGRARRRRVRFGRGHDARARRADRALPARAASRPQPAALVPAPARARARRRRRALPRCSTSSRSRRRMRGCGSSTPAPKIGFHRGRIIVHPPAVAPFAVAWRGESALALPHGTLEFAWCAGAGIAREALEGNAVTVRSRTGGERLRPAPGRPSRSLKRLLQEAAMPAVGARIAAARLLRRRAGRRSRHRRRRRVSGARRRAGLRGRMAPRPAQRLMRINRQPRIGRYAATTVGATPRTSVARSRAPQMEDSMKRRTALAITVAALLRRHGPRFGAAADRHQVQPRRRRRHAEGQGRRVFQEARRGAHQGPRQGRGLSEQLALQGRRGNGGAAAGLGPDAGAVAREVRPARRARVRGVRPAVHLRQLRRAAQGHRAARSARRCSRSSSPRASSASPTGTTASR